jgi:SagB-type dehydrogenase family enzyme
MSAARDAGRLPPPGADGKWSLESALRRRRSVRDYARGPLTRAELGQLLWAAQGITGPDGLRAAPSAGALYPLEIYVAAGEVSELPDGIYRYRAARHELESCAAGDIRAELAAAALGQECVAGAAAVIGFAAVYSRATAKYGKRGIQYAHMEVGHAAQNVYLQAAALDLGTVVVGAFEDSRVKRVMKMAAEEEPVCLMPVGRMP